MTLRDEDNWVEDEFQGYDTLRYDPDSICYECQKCGTELEKAADRSGGIARCPECEYMVHSW